MDRQSFRLLLPGAAAVAALCTGCATTISGRVVNPDGSALTQADVTVYTAPRSSTVHAEKNGAFKLSKDVTPESEYTLIAEDRDGNTGYVRGYKPKKGDNAGVLVRLSREMEAKDAVLEGAGRSEGVNGIGEKILKSSQ